MALKYKYHRIQTRNSIRLVELSPGSTDDPRVHCKIIHTDLGASRDRFEAVSYTWGDANERQTILCGEDNAELEVPLNCVTTALRYPRDPQRVRTPWIDAVCIDQSNIAEQNAQVRIMGRIFATAKQTVIFLGENTIESRPLFQHLAEADKWLEDGKQNPAPESEQILISELEELFRRLWVSRIWVIQELFHSQRALFLCGHYSVSYEAIHECRFGYDKGFQVTSIVPAPLDIKKAKIIWYI